MRLSAVLNTSGLGRITGILLLLVALLQPLVSLASDEILIVRISHYQQDQQLLIDSESHFRLPEKVIEAIHHEIPIHFKTQIHLTESSSVLGIPFERERQNIEYHTQVYAYGVNRHYVLYNSRNHKAQGFQTLESALQTLGTLDAFPVASLSELHPQQRYTLRMRISLDPWQLPAPLILESLLDPDWQVDSGWFEVTLQTPKSWQ